MKMKILFVNHTSRISGAERSLLQTLDLMKSQADVVLACPEGELAVEARARGAATIQIDALQFSFGSDVRTLTQAFLRLVRGGFAIRGIVRRTQVDVIHAGSARAGLLIALCMHTGARRVIDVRDSLPNTASGALVRWALRLSADALIFNSRYTQSRFGRTGPARTIVVYPTIDRGAFSRNLAPDLGELPQRISDPPGCRRTDHAVERTGRCNQDARGSPRARPECPSAPGRRSGLW